MTATTQGGTWSLTQDGNEYITDAWGAFNNLKQMSFFREKDELGGLRIVVTGGRDFKDLRHDFIGMLELIVPNELHEGGAMGADRLAGAWAARVNIRRVTHLADWRQYGTMAGRIRNQQMLIAAKPHFVMAAPGGRGTQHCIAEALRRDIPVFRLCGDDS